MPGFAQTLEKGDSLSRVGRYRESVTAYELFIEYNPRRVYDHSVAWLGISYNLLQLGEYDGSLQANDRSRAIREQLRLDDVSENFMRYGAIYLQQGAYERALSNLRHAKTMPVADPYLFALMEGYMAGAYAGMKNYQEAERHYLLSLESLSAEVGDHHPDVSMGLYNLGRLYLIQGRTAEAKETFLRAYHAEEHLDTHAGRLGLILLALGEIAWAESGHIAARSYFLRALDTFESTFGSPHRETARALWYLSKAALAGADLPEAASRIQQALQAICPGFEDENFTHDPDPALPLLDRVLAAEIYMQKAQCVAAQEVPGTVERELKYYAAAIALLEVEAMWVQNDDARLRMVSQLPKVAGEGIAAALRSGDDTHARLAFGWSERAKAALLRVQVAQTSAGLPQLSEERRLLQEWREAELYFQLDPLDVSASRLLAERQAAFFAFADRIRAEVPAYLNARLAGQTVKVEDVQALLDEKTALLSYFIGEEAYYIFALSSKAFSAQALPFRHLEKSAKVAATLRKISQLSPGNYTKVDNAVQLPTLQESVKGFQAAIRRVKRDDFVFYGADLYNKLIQPVRSLLSGKNKLVVIPHDLLSSLPFEAIISPLEEEQEGKTPYHKMPYLVKNYAVEYHYAATLWATPQVSPAGQRAFTGFAPVFDEGMLSEGGKVLFDTAYQFLPALRAISPDGVRFQALPESEQEVASASVLFQKLPGGAGIFLRGEATEAAVRQIAGNSRIVHFATHGFVHDYNPQLSGLALTANGNDDGILYLTEIQALDWRGALCVLSSCDSGSGAEAQGEGVLSPAYAFFRGGAGGVIASLWQVYDRYNTRLFGEFYRQHAAGRSNAEALRLAKLALIKDKTAAEPRKWSGMIFIGK